MSLEIALQENTATMRELIAALNNMPHIGTPVAAPIEEPVVEQTEEPAEVAQEPATEKPTGRSAKKSQEPAATPEPKAEPAAAEPQAEPVTYEQVSQAIKKLAATKGRESAVEVLRAHGVAKGTDLQPKQYAAVYRDAVQAQEA